MLLEHQDLNIKEYGMHYSLLERPMGSEGCIKVPHQMSGAQVPLGASTSCCKYFRE